jgi:16S rRNA (cytosine1407-C5)-methyltransferase
MPSHEFEDFFSARFGARWPALREALLAPGDAEEYGHGLLAPYRLDSASVFAATALCEALVTEDASDAAFDSDDAGRFSGQILDACAAPGGKTLVMASLIAESHPGATILANELSSDRRRRLVDVLNAHLPPDLRARVTVSGFDAAAAGARASERGRFGAVLLDAPCSSERHVIADPAALAQWTPSRVRSLAQRQWALLSSAFLLLAPGGALVYATCALCSEENDGPMLKLLKKYGDQARLLPIEAPEGTRQAAAERTQCGLHFLPDTAGGAGPLYIARIVKAL